MRFPKNLCLLCLVLSVFTLSSQPLPEKVLKKIDRAKEKYDKGKYEKAEEIYVKLLEDYPSSGMIWNELAITRFTIYRKKKQYDDLFVGDITVTVKDKDGKEKPGNDSMANALRDMLQQASPGKVAYQSFINTCREGALHSEFAERCSMYLRINLIDQKTDTAVSDTAVTEFNLAEKEFGKKNYSLAIEHYKKAIGLQPDFFKARLYLGDTYYAKKEYTGAIQYFKEATQVRPTQQEAWKYLTDAYYHSGAYNDALRACIEGILVYPDIGMFFKLEDAEKLAGKTFSRHWTQRQVFPKLTEENLSQKVKDTDWQVYLSALKEIAPFCDKRGVVTKTNDITKTQYADVYAFEKMVNQSRSPRFDFAKQAMLKGYFDCYVLFSQYHYDINGQYQHFARQNKDKLKEYINFLCD